ncbi:MAG: Holliday junction resolvase RuvX [Melioribacteraceae bacterium]|nr:Holliday junction resolvase RuvX [Melioribacteraceae bacterium]MCF8355268.1 Holliday junction resolvase RuvX [Melioribacteraceae bacterium]MCF8394167.1 Holliday junction resolvase RuvX [Melioribacteraceae bacterium]MCF8418850.1 Holliday junction resolvase RuvX [Melioribacteraceae bacterium]
MKDNTERIISIDYGEKRIGIAITDPLKMFAYPLLTLENDLKFFINFEKLLEQYNIIKIILGNPLREDGKPGRLDQEISKFRQRLISKYRIPVQLFDERYSSGIASRRVIETVSSKKKRKNKGLIDMNAACVILEDYLKEVDS